MRDSDDADRPAPRLRRFSVSSFTEQSESNLSALELQERAREAVSRIVAECVRRPYPLADIRQCLTWWS